MTSPAKPLVVFDFDGVIANSFHDSLWMAISTFMDQVPGHRLPVSTPLAPADIFDFEAAHPAFTETFYQLMPLSNLARDYYVILHIMTEGDPADITNQAAYDQYKTALDHDALMAYDADFYARRRTFQKHDPETWAAIIPAFEGIPEAIATLSEKAALAIATSKDKPSVRLLLDHYGLTPFFPDEWILDKDFAPSKRQHLLRLSELTETPLDAMHFIDDKVLHLTGLTDLPLNACLAQWGFNTDREAEVARNHGCRVLTLDQLPDLV